MTIDHNVSLNNQILEKSHSKEETQAHKFFYRKKHSCLKLKTLVDSVSILAGSSQKD